MMQLYDTLTQKKTVFTPLSKTQVSLYVCGVTAYDHCHIGHARAYIVFDSLKRQLLHQGYSVTHIQNFTDIDDKIIAKAQKQGQSIGDLTAYYIQSYFHDMQALNILPASVYPKATEHITIMQAAIQDLLTAGVAHQDSNNDIVFNINAYSAYGDLSKKIRSELESGHRGVHGDGQHFVLWKQAKSGEPSWPSPWGDGRPGWHSECSAMARSYLGDTIDIHGGGEDLIFPHHENERAQAECCSGQPFVRYWVHNGFVTTDHKKMSKSLNNALSIREILKTVSPMALRFYLLRTHYRSQFQFSYAGLAASTKSLQKLFQLLDTDDTAPETDAQRADLAGYFQAVIDYLDDDLNTVGAIGVIFELAKYCQKTGVGRSALRRCLAHIGIIVPSDTKKLSPELAALLAARETARAEKAFEKADLLRDELLHHGIRIKDTRTGTSWQWVDDYDKL